MIGQAIIVALIAWLVLVLLALSIDQRIQGGAR